MISNKLRTARKERQLTQEQLAELIDSTFDKVSRWETGRQPISVAELLKVAKTLQIDPAWFYAEESNSQPQDPTLRREAIKASVLFLAQTGRLNQDPEQVADFLSAVAEFYSDPAQPRRREGLEDALAAIFSHSGLK